MIRVLVWTAGFALMAGLALAAKASDDAALRERAHAALLAAMNNDPLKSMHAAEVLAWDGYGAEAYAAYEKQLPTATGQAQIGAWRVLAQCAPDAASRRRYVELVRNAALDTKGPYAEFALESLAKLGYAGHEAPFVEQAESGGPIMKILARWVIANSGKAQDEAALAKLLDLPAQPDSRNRGVSAYALRFLKHLRPATIAKLRSVCAAEPATGAGRVFFVTTLYVHDQAANRDALKQELFRYAETGDQEARYQSLLVIGKWAGKSDLPHLERFLSDADADIRIASAHAILTTLARKGSAS